MNNNQEAIKIKIITGPNEGAVSVLKQGRYSLGKDDSCDLVIYDSSLTDHHIDLEISESNDVLLFPVGGDVSINHQLCETTSPVLQFETVGLGNTQFVLGPEHSPWPDLINMHLHREENVSELDEDSVSSIIEETTIDSTGNKTPVLNELRADSAKNLSTNLKSVAEPFWQKSKWLIILAASIFVLMITGSNIGTDTRALEKLALSASQSEALDSIFKDSKYSENLEIVKSASGKPSLTGYIDDDEAFKTLKEKFNNLSLDIMFDVKNTKELADDAQDILHAMDFEKVTLMPMEKGKLVAKGYIRNSTSWSKTKMLIQQDVKGISSIEDVNIKNQDTFIRYIQMVAKKLSIDSLIGVGISKDSESIIVTGDLSENEYENWNRIKSGFKQRYGNLIQLNDQVSVKKKNLLKLAIKSVSIGDISYIKLKDNNKYMVGSIIEGGYKIEDIQPSKLVLSKNNKKFDYLIGEGKSYE
ncbi:MAG: type III secretion system inner membrane ring subunit SctD [Gammaproteobacteria bacterium]